MIVKIADTRYHVTREENMLHLRSKDKKTHIKIEHKEVINTNPSIIFQHWKKIAEYIKENNLKCDLDDILDIKVKDHGLLDFSLNKTKEDLVYGDWVVPAVGELEDWECIDA